MNKRVTKLHILQPIHQLSVWDTVIYWYVGSIWLSCDVSISLTIQFSVIPPYASLQETILDAKVQYNQAFCTRPINEICNSSWKWIFLHSLNKGYLTVHIWVDIMKQLEKFYQWLNHVFFKEPLFLWSSNLYETIHIYTTVEIIEDQRTWNWNLFTRHFP